MDLVRLEDVSKVYRVGETEVNALRGIDLSLPAGGFICFVGPSGSGKTTLLNMIGCLDRPTRGRVIIDGQDVTDLSRHKSAHFRGRKLGFIFQSFNLLPVLTAAENVALPLVMVQHLPKADRNREVVSLLDAVGMSDQRHKYPNQLSGGQKQRVAVARALVTRPSLILADEPTANLDRATAQRVVDLMKSLRDKFGSTFVFSTHDLGLVQHAETIYELVDGQLNHNHRQPGENHV
jgi:putative ABC transport system ATP-binding protein